MKIWILILVLSFCYKNSYSQFYDDSLIFPVKGLSISSPKPNELDRFLKFIDEELKPRKLNTLLLRVDYNYQYISHPELRDSIALSKDDVKRIVDLCKADHINLIPQINLLGHQSWASNTGRLLSVYPQFDETPAVKMPEKYVWPNAEGLYCKSYCPLHPDVHKIIFELIDEICDAFQSTAFHAGMDEVFYLGDDKCPRCGGRDKAELFANEVRIINEHLKIKNRDLWIWGDRCIDGKNTGIGMWEASMNFTAKSIDLIPRDVVICDWHYERPDQTPVLFASKGLRVITCPWNRPQVASMQVEDMIRWRKNATKTMRPYYYGMMQTVWASVTSFLDEFYGIAPKTPPARPDRVGKQAECIRLIFDKMSIAEKNK